MGIFTFRTVVITAEDGVDPDTVNKFAAMQ